MSSYTPAQTEEIEKLLKYIEQMEGIIRTSPSKEQVTRVRKQLSQIVTKLMALVPGLDRAHIRPDDIRKKVFGTIGGASPIAAARTPATASAARRAEPTTEKLDILARFPVEAASPHCTDVDVNFLATSMRVIHREYWPVLSEQHCRLDFSNSSERDVIRTKLESSNRSLKILTETIEEYATAEKQDFREQLLKMKNKQTRLFLFETNDTLKELRGFLRKLTDDLDRNGGIVLNKTDTIHFNLKFEDATVLEGVVVSAGLHEFDHYVTQVIEKLNLPQMKLDSNKPHF